MAVLSVLVGCVLICPLRSTELVSGACCPKYLCVEYLCAQFLFGSWGMMKARPREVEPLSEAVSQHLSGFCPLGRWPQALCTFLRARVAGVRGLGVGLGWQPGSPETFQQPSEDELAEGDCPAGPELQRPRKHVCLLGDLLYIPAASAALHTRPQVVL